MTIAPFGSWPSTISAASLVEAAVGLSQLEVADGRAYWLEARPGEAGRQVIVSQPLEGAGPPEDVLPAGLSARTLVHEYGGRCFTVHAGAVVFSSWADQRLWRLDPGGDLRPLTAEPAGAGADRFADPVVTPDGGWVLCVHEHHEAGEVANQLVAVPFDPPAGGSAPRVLASGHDFYAAPRPSPAGDRLAWLTWDHPDMPWDATCLWVAPLGAGATVGEARLVAGAAPGSGGPAESVTQPRWSPAGVLHYVSDRTGWWNLYDESGAALCPRAAEFGQPDWVFGNRSYGFGPGGAVVAVWSDGTGSHLGTVAGGMATERPLPFSAFSAVHVVGDDVLAIAASPTAAPAVVRIGAGGGIEVLRRSRERTPDPAALSVPSRVEFPTGEGETAHALVYPPANPGWEGLPGERPPLVVVSHGGPTSAASATLNPAVQYWTSRGFAVADVDYRGSSGYGRAYRDRLRGGWGLVDVEDCARVVDWLAGQGLVDGDRAVIRGGSAGGFTALAALAFTDAFRAGASLYGVADLELLAGDSNKFEARYLDWLVGPYPEAAAEYRRRSPLHHADAITCPLILFQGLDDTVVPPEQSELMYRALRDRGVPVAYLAFEGEQHGFRRAATIQRVAEAELAFYGRVLGFTPADAVDPVPLANEEALGAGP